MIVFRIWRGAIVLIAVLTEIGIMKCLGFIVLALVCVRNGLGYCPSLCLCNKVSDVPSSELLPGELLRLKCGGSPTQSAQITELKEIDLSKLWNIVVSL